MDLADPSEQYWKESHNQRKENRINQYAKVRRTRFAHQGQFVGIE